MSHALVTSAALILALATLSRPAAAQLESTLPGPLARVPIGARVRFLDSSGTMIEGRVALKREAAFWLQGADSRPAREIHVGDIRMLEVHSAPASRSRTTMRSAAVGGVLGALAGAAAHGDAGEGSPGFGGPTGKGESIAVGAIYGGVIGGLIGRYILARDRWNRVNLQ